MGGWTIRGLSTFAPLYQRVYVPSSTIRVKFFNTAASGCMVAILPQMGNTAPSIITEDVWVQNTYASWKIMAPRDFGNDNTAIIRKYLPVSKLVGTSTSVDKDDYAFPSPSTSGVTLPSNSAYWMVMVAPADNNVLSTASASYEVSLTYYVEMYNKVSNL